MRHPGEPTVEELLDSIKRVIAREDQGRRVTGADPAADQGNVLDLARHGYALETPTPAPPLLAEGTSADLRGSLDALAAATARPAAPTPAASADSALEPLVRELLRPALAEWLDRNLPAIVERMVAAEIARISARGG